MSSKISFPVVIGLDSIPIVPRLVARDCLTNASCSFLPNFQRSFLILHSWGRMCKDSCIAGEECAKIQMLSLPLLSHEKEQKPTAASSRKLNFLDVWRG